MKRLLLFSCCALVFGLVACESVYPPYMFPTGYKHHGSEFKSPLPPKSRRFTALQRKHLGPENAEAWRDAVYDLLTRLTGRAGLPPKPVYVMQPDPMPTFYTNFDNDLREAMRHTGYTLADFPDDAYVFTYEAMHIDRSGPMDATPLTEEEANVILVLRVFNGLGPESQMLTEERGTYYIQGAETFAIPPSSHALRPAIDTISPEGMQFEVNE